MTALDIQTARLRRPDLAARNTTHGLSRVYPRTYRSWKDMRARCNNPHDADYAGYGGRGIAVCERWSDFAVFFADMGDRPAGRTLDRVDVDGPYSPENCRWADHSTQANNKRSNRLIEMGGVVKTLQQWCHQFGLEHSKVRYRLSRGMSPDVAFSARDLRK